MYDGQFQSWTSLKYDKIGDNEHNGQVSLAVASGAETRNECISISCRNRYTEREREKRKEARRLLRQ